MTCQLIGFARSAFRRSPGLKDDTELRAAIRKTALKHKSSGYRMITDLLRQQFNTPLNYKRVYRIYRAEGLVKRRKHRKSRVPLEARKPLIVSELPRTRWSMDFISDSMRGGRKLRALNIIDDCSRRLLYQVVDTSIGGRRVKRALDELAMRIGLPKQIVLDNGPEFTCHAMADWSEENQVELAFIEKGKPQQNAFIESFHGRFRDECLNQHLFQDIHDARKIIGEWMNFYNNERPHSSLNGLPPARYEEELVKKMT